jgi:sulfur carrier protein ThiS
MIQVILNGQPETLAPDLTVFALLEARGLVGKRLAVERNGEIVPRPATPRSNSPMATSSKSSSRSAVAERAALLGAP